MGSYLFQRPFMQGLGKRPRATGHLIHYAPEGVNQGAVAAMINPVPIFSYPVQAGYKALVFDGAGLQ